MSGTAVGIPSCLVTSKRYPLVIYGSGVPILLHFRSDWSGIGLDSFWGHKSHFFALFDQAKACKSMQKHAKACKTSKSKQKQAKASKSKQEQAKASKSKQKHAKASKSRQKRAKASKSKQKRAKTTTSTQISIYKKTKKTIDRSMAACTMSNCHRHAMIIDAFSNFLTRNKSKMACL